MKRILFILIAFNLSITGAFAGNNTEVNDDTGIWWSAMGRANASLVFNTDKGALETLKQVVKSSEAGKILSTQVLDGLVMGTMDSASVNLRDLMMASTGKLGVSQETQNSIIATYDKNHPNTKLNCRQINQQVMCVIQ